MKRPTSLRVGSHLLSHKLVALQVQAAEVELDLVSNLFRKIRRHSNWLLR